MSIKRGLFNSALKCTYLQTGIIINTPIMCADSWCLLRQASLLQMLKILNLSRNDSSNLFQVIRHYFHMLEDKTGETPTELNHLYRPEDLETCGRWTLLTRTSKKKHPQHPRNLLETTHSTLVSFTQTSSSSKRPESSCSPAAVHSY